jgi:hypothetical protein
MSSFGSGLIGALAAGAGGYAEGQQIGARELVAALARKRALERQAAQDQLQREEFEHRKETDAANLMTRGYTPASTEITTEAPAPVTAPIPTFDAALEHGLEAPAGPPSSLTTPITEGSLGTIPKVRVVDTPASFDPMAGTQGALEKMREEARAEEHQKTLDSQEKRATAANQSRELIAKLRAANAAQRSGASGTRPMTANARESNARQAAKALLNIHGSKEAALAWLASPEGEAARQQGVQPFHFDVAAGLQQEGDTRAAIGMSHTMKPERAVERVRGVRAAVTAASGKDSPSIPRGLPPLTKAERDRAAADPLYKQFKESKGYKF